MLPKIEDAIATIGDTTHATLDVAIHVLEYLLATAPELLSRDVMEVDGKYTELTFHLKASIEDALAKSRR